MNASKLYDREEATVWAEDGTGGDSGIWLVRHSSN